MELIGYKQVNGWLWPASDEDCLAVTFQNVDDLDIALKHCKKFDVAVQAGGNTGVWPKYLSKHFKTIYTFEPESHNFHCLAYNCDEPNIIKFQAALGAGRKMIGMALEHGPRNMGACYVNGGGNIPVLRIDDLKLPACDFIQLDVEGYEYSVLTGAISLTIPEYHPVIMLEDKGLSEKYGTRQGEVEDLLKQFGYQVVARVNRDIILTCLS